MGVAILIDYSENKIIMYFENEAKPGVFQSSVQLTYILQEHQANKVESKHLQWPKFCTLPFL